MNLYLHIPFCHHKCSYCHFYSEVSDQINDYVAALIHDINQNLPRHSYETIYFGGGTPSLLSTNHLKQIISVIGGNPKEINLEANPDSIINHDPQELVDAGINRISLGIQSWDETILKHMDRQCDHAKLITYIQLLKDAGLTNINLDHIISYPNQTDDILIQDIKQSLSLNPTHISIYPLEIHPHTKLQDLTQDESRVVHQFSLVQTMLIKAGYHHYEELNFCLPGYECQHNLHFWQGKDYLGFGPGAVSRVGNTITENVASITAYINAITSGQSPPSTITKLSDNQIHKMKQDLKNRLI